MPHHATTMPTTPSSAAIAVIGMPQEMETIVSARRSPLLKLWRGLRCAFAFLDGALDAL